MTDRFAALREVVAHHSDCDPDEGACDWGPDSHILYDPDFGVAALLAAYDEASSAAASHLAGLQVLADKRDAMLAENERLREALDTYGHHPPDCAFWHGKCSCGLRAALEGKPARLEEPAEGGEG